MLVFPNVKRVDGSFKVYWDVFFFIVTKWLFCNFSMSIQFLLVHETINKSNRSNIKVITLELIIQVLTHFENHLESLHFLHHISTYYVSGSHKHYEHQTVCNCMCMVRIDITLLCCLCMLSMFPLNFMFWFKSRYSMCHIPSIRFDLSSCVLIS